MRPLFAVLIGVALGVGLVVATDKKKPNLGDRRDWISASRMSWTEWHREYPNDKKAEYQEMRRLGKAYEEGYDS